jgi:ubiquitin carboxyl-terminal hydrolase MINDY-1/2
MIAAGLTFSFIDLHQNRDVPILLQNENGPCPLLAASNCLLLRGSVTLPAHAIRNNVTSLEDITNMLADYAMTRASSSESNNGSDAFVPNDAHDQFLLDELLRYIPKFQDGMVRKCDCSIARFFFFRS